MFLEIIGTTLLAGSCYSSVRVVQISKMLYVIGSGQRNRKMIGNVTRGIKVSELPFNGCLSRRTESYGEYVKGDQMITRYLGPEEIALPRVCIIRDFDISNLFPLMEKELARHVVMPVRNKVVITKEINHDDITVFGKFDGVRFDPKKTYLLSGKTNVISDNSVADLLMFISASATGLIFGSFIFDW